MAPARRGAAVGEGERRWVAVPEFAAYLGISERQVRRMLDTDPDLKLITKRIGRRVLVCIWAWKQRVEGRMVA